MMAAWLFGLDGGRTSRPNTIDTPTHGFDVMVPAACIDVDVTACWYTTAIARAVLVTRRYWVHPAVRDAMTDPVPPMDPNATASAPAFGVTAGDDQAVEAAPGTVAVAATSIGAPRLTPVRENMIHDTDPLTDEFTVTVSVGTSAVASRDVNACILAVLPVPPVVNGPPGTAVHVLLLESDMVMVAVTDDDWATFTTYVPAGTSIPTALECGIAAAADS